MLGGLYVLLFALGMFLLSDAIMDVFRGSETSFDTVPFHALGRTLMWLMLSWAAFDDGRVVVCRCGIIRRRCSWRGGMGRLQRAAPVSETVRTWAEDKM